MSIAHFCLCGYFKEMIFRTVICSSLMVAGGFCDEAKFDFNQKEVPESLEDLKSIQAALQRGLERARAATVCLQIGGGSGSAVIISEDGLVLTAAHVTGAVNKEMDVVLEDGTKLKGVSLGLHSETDSAMLQIKGDGPFPFVDVDLKDSTTLGDWVYSLGHSGGFDKGRGVNIRLGRLVRQANSTVQSDCMLIGGDSGGPLFNMAGQLIGIHSRVGGSREQSMHVPIREFQDHWDELRRGDFIGEGPFAKKKKPQLGSGFLGLRVEDLEEGGVKVAEVWEGSAAAEAGIEVGDIILEIQGEAATDEVLGAKLGELAVGGKLKLKWRSGEDEKEEEVELGERP